MNDRTINIILITKRFGKPNNVKKAIAKYMSEECNCPIETYTDSILMSILKEAMFDFLHNASRKSDMIAFTREIVEEHRYDSMLDKIIIAFSMIQVCEKDGWEYKNLHGWHETEFTKRLDNEEWSL
jgi:hypothetical protein